jgi:hypothetical protein
MTQASAGWAVAEPYPTTMQMDAATAASQVFQFRMRLSCVVIHPPFAYDFDGTPHLVKVE